MSRFSLPTQARGTEHHKDIAGSDLERVGITARLVRQGKLSTSRFLTFPVSNLKKRRYADLAMYRIVSEHFKLHHIEKRKYSLQFPFTEYDNTALRTFASLGLSVPDYRKWTKSPDPVPLYCGLLKFAEQLPARPTCHADEVLIRNIVNQAVSELLPVKVKPFTFEQIVDHLDGTTSAGYAHHCKKADVLSDPQFFSNLDRYMWSDIDTASNPCKFACKGRLSKIEDPKSRLIWVYPIEHVFIEGMIAYSMYQSLKSRETPMHFGLGAIDRLKRNLVSTQDGYRVTTDWSGFDQHVPAWLIHMVFDALFSKVDLKRWDTPAHNSGLTYRYMQRAMKLTREYFVHTPFVMPDGHVYYKHQGVPSGSPFTQLVDTVVNMTMVRFALTKLHVSFRHDEYLGDDATFVVDCDFTSFLGSFAAISKSYFGSILSTKKTVVARNGYDVTEFLGYKISMGGIVYDRHKLPLYLIVANDCADNPPLTWMRILGFAATGASSVPWFWDFTHEFLRLTPAAVQVDKGLFSTSEGRYIQAKLKYTLGLSDSTLRTSLEAASLAGQEMLSRRLPELLHTLSGPPGRWAPDQCTFN